MMSGLQVGQSPEAGRARRVTAVTDGFPGGSEYLRLFMARNLTDCDGDSDCHGDLVTVKLEPL